MKKRRIAVDCDDVIVQTAPLIVGHYNKKYGTRLELRHMYTDNLEAWGVLDNATAIARVEEYLVTDEYRTVPPTREAVEQLAQLAGQYELHVVTGRTEFLRAATQVLLDNHFPGLFKSIEFTSFYGERPRSKADVCREIGADMLIDDHLGHALPVAKSGVEVLLFGDYPWNQAADLPSNIRRVSDWRDVNGLLLATR